jgi:hypothetical protein
VMGVRGGRAGSRACPPPPPPPRPPPPRPRVARLQRYPRVVEAIGQLRQLHGGAYFAELVGLLRVASHFFAVEIKHNETIFRGVEVRDDI